VRDVSNGRSFPRSPEAIRAARRYAEECAPDLEPELLATVVLLVSELATNAVRHAGSGFTLTITEQRSEVKVEVEDLGPGEPIVRSPQPADPNGRGMRIVERLADSWGVDHAEGSKTVWFTVRRPGGR
jgi:anti-sigma regulatory factor (Ser/Thr protein kinase)